MHDYENLKHKYGSSVPQVIDTPILVLDYFTLGEVFSSLGAMFFFGVVLYSIPMVFISCVLILGIAPVIRKKNKRGVFLHYPYKRFHMSLPGLVNPKGHRKYSD